MTGFVPITRLRIRKREHVDHDTVVRHETVFCPFRGESRDVTSCLACPHFAEVAADGTTIVCARPPPSHDAGGALCLGRESIGAHVAVGAIVQVPFLCASGRTSLAVVAPRAIDADVRGVVVVDHALRPIGFIGREQLEAAGRYATLVTVAESARPEACLAEDVPLSEAIERMVHEHRRVFVTIDAAGRATGVLSDIDLLRWFTRARRLAESLPEEET